MEWKILDTGINSAELNMRYDAELLESLDPSGPALLHFYEWEADSATHGYFTDPFDYLDAANSRQMGLQLARRPTGGGIIFHTWDLAFSLLIPARSSCFSLNTLDNYLFVNRRVGQAVEEFLGKEVASTLTPVDFIPKSQDCSRFCMANPTKFDVLIEGKKVVGAAQRRRRQGLLHQGSISLLMPPEEYLDQILKKNLQVKEGMLENTFPLLGKETSKSGMMQARSELKQLLIKHVTHEST